MSRAVARERHGEIVDAELGGELMSLAILVGQRAGRQAAALPVDALVVGQLAADHDARVDARAVDVRDVQHDLAVVEQQRVAGAHVLRQALVGDADGCWRAGAWRPARRRARRRRLRSASPCLRRSARCGSSGPAGRRARATHLPTCSATVAHHLRRAWRAPAASPCEKLTRTTSAPARSMSASTLGLSVAGPSVARILVRRSIETLSVNGWRPRSSSTATAGSFLPSRNSRNAPPPVEM